MGLYWWIGMLTFRAYYWDGWWCGVHILLDFSLPNSLWIATIRHHCGISVLGPINFQLILAMVQKRINWLSYKCGGSRKIHCSWKTDILSFFYARCCPLFLGVTLRLNHINWSIQYFIFFQIILFSPSGYNLFCAILIAIVS